MTAGSANVPRLLENAHRALDFAAAMRDDAGSAAPDPHLTSFIRLSLDDAPASHVLQRAAAQLAAGWPTGVATTTVLYEAMTLTGADLGNVQLAEPATHELRIVASAGFGREFLDYFATVADDTSACGRAAAERRQTVIADVDIDLGYNPHRDIAAASKFRAVQSTPLIDAEGNLVGMVSTHFPRPGAPAARALEVTRLYGLLAGEALARGLSGRTAPHLDGQHGAGRARPESSSALPRTAVLDLTDTIVRALLSAGLSLAGAQSLISDGAASGLVAEAIDELDQTLGGIRSAVLDLHR